MRVATVFNICLTSTAKTELEVFVPRWPVAEILLMHCERQHGSIRAAANVFIFRITRTLSTLPSSSISLSTKTQALKWLPGPQLRGHFRATWLCAWIPKWFTSRLWEFSALHLLHVNRFARSVSCVSPHLNQTLQTKFSLCGRFSRNRGSMPKMSTHQACFVDLDKAYGRVTCQKQGECCGSAVLTAIYYCPSNNCIPAQKFCVRVGGVDHNHSQWELDCDRAVCCPHSPS